MQYEPSGSSYRDPAGFIFMRKGIIYRQINQAGREDFELMVSSGLYDALVSEKLLVPHTTVKLTGLSDDPNRYSIIKPEPIPFISYPYEWSFPQLRDAALLTLTIQKRALEHGMVLKDASAYNVQFIGKRALFIDTLSFTKYQAGSPWEGYKQFCEHFLAPLAIAHYSSEQFLTSLQTYIDGVPLGLAIKLLPRRAHFKKGLLAHLFLHAGAQAKHQGSGSKSAAAPARKISTFALNGLMGSLEVAIKALSPPKGATEWGDYYEFTNYDNQAFKDKAMQVEALLGKLPQAPKLVWDIGANNGEFSELAARRGAYTVACDIDAKAVAANYNKQSQLNDLVLPLRQDIAAPSPSIGWELDERASFLQRGPADVVLALAVIHHLAIGRNVPLPKIAAMLNKLSGNVIIEFVPKQDSKVRQLLSSRPDIFPHYDTKHFEAAMAKYYKVVEKKQIKNSERWLYLYSR